MLAVPFAAGFRVWVADIHYMPVSSGSVLFLGLQQRTSHGPAPCSSLTCQRRQDMREITRQYRMCPLWERRGSSTCCGAGTVATVLEDDRGLWGMGSQVMGSRRVLYVF